jgi:hypothetical protein
VPRGGKRAGAGRKPGSANRKTRKIADRAAEEGITPLEVMLFVMRKHFKAKDYDEAAAVAANCAAYVHPRLGSMQVKGDLAVTVIEDNGWYGNDAHDLAASRSAAPAAGTP